jgi:hypothetical protein
MLLACVAQHPTEDIGRACLGPVLAQILGHTQPLLDAQYRRVGRD